MTAQFDAATTSSSAATTAFSFNHTITAGVTNGAVAVLIAFSSAQANTVTVTVGGSSAAAVTSADTQDTNVRAAIWRAATGSTTGAVAVAGTLSAADTFAVTAMSAKGVDQTTICNNGKGATVAFAGWSTSGALLMTSAVGDLSFDIVTDNSGGTPSGFSTDQTEKWKFTSNFAVTSEGGIATTPAATVNHVTSNTADNAGVHVGANFVQAAAASGDETLSSRRMLSVP